MTQATVFNIQRFSLHDGPGIRTTVFLKGCNLRCAWCHNPESQRITPEVQYHVHKCLHCGRCVSLCPAHCLNIQEDGLHICHEKCTGCGKAEAMCPAGALCVSGRSMSAQEVFSTVLRDKSFYEADGGVTLSGGEPLLWPEWCVELLCLLEEAGIHTCISTAGNVPQKTLETIVPHTGLFLYDLKHIDPVRHREGTGCTNETILENLKFLSDNGAHVLVRMPIIPGFNADGQTVRGVARFMRENTRFHALELLPYHKMGERKYDTLGMVSKTTGLQEPDAMLMSALRREIREEGISAL